MKAAENPLRSAYLAELLPELVSRASQGKLSDDDLRAAADGFVTLALGLAKGLAHVAEGTAALVMNDRDDSSGRPNCGAFQDHESVGRMLVWVESSADVIAALLGAAEMARGDTD